MINFKELYIVRQIQRLINSSNYAIEGILYAIQTERHVKIHLIAAFTVLVFAFAIGIQKNDFIDVVLICCIVIVAEMFNTAIEVIVDMVSPHHSEGARIAKDIAAGAVLICAIAAVVIGYIIFYPYFCNIYLNGFKLASHYGEYVAVLSFMVVMIIIVAIKIYVGHEHPLRGGGASGYAALSFSAWVSLVIMIPQHWIGWILLIPILGISSQRLYKKLHSPLEVLVGILIGSTVTFFLFKLFYIKWR